MLIPLKMSVNSNMAEQKCGVTTLATDACRTCIKKIRCAGIVLYSDDAIGKKVRFMQLQLCQTDGEFIETKLCSMDTVCVY
jgi:TPP-dependent indolepyruvate ferredoxin oxidoreductase alpha subunit